MAKERLLFMDLAKFIAIACVCIGHVYAMSSLSNNNSIMNRCIYSFHMPLFMLLCGFFSGSSLSMSFGNFIKKKAKALLLPVLSFTLLSCVFITFGGGANLKARYVNEAIGGMWFLRTVFFCFVIAYAAKQVKLPDYVCSILSCLLVMFIPHGWFLQTNFLLLFFWTGYFLKKYWGDYYCHRGILTIVAALFYVFGGRIDHINVITPQVLMTDVALLPMQYLTGLSASLVVIGVASYISTYCKLENNSMMPTIGRYTLGIYGVQTILLERIAHSLFYIAVPSGWIVVYDFVVIPAIGLFFCFLSYYVVRMTAKNKTMNFLLYGNMYQ